jgi:glutaredoxin
LKSGTKGQSKVKIRIFSASWCQDCLNVLSLIKKYSISFEYIDIDDEECEVQDFCDENKVDKIPHIQFLSETGSVIIEHVGAISPDQFAKYIKDYNKD